MDKAQGVALMSHRSKVYATGWCKVCNSTYTHIQGSQGIHTGKRGEGIKGGRGVSLSIRNTIRHFLGKNTTMQNPLYVQHTAILKAP